MKILIAVIGCTNIMTSNPLCYSARRSIYTNEERFCQLIDTIESIKKYVIEKSPNVYDIIIYEKSTLEKDQYNFLTGNYPEIKLILETDPVVLAQRDSPFKGPAELMCLKKILESKDIVNNYDIVFKVVARYRFNKNFTPCVYTPENIFVKKAAEGVIFTGFISIPVKLKDIYISHLEKVIDQTKNKPISIEAIMDLPEHTVYVDGLLGVEGNIGVDGNFFSR